MCPSSTGASFTGPTRSRGDCVSCCWRRIGPARTSRLRTHPTGKIRMTRFYSSSRSMDTSGSTPMWSSYGKPAGWRWP
eukprot:27667-Prymnesium_polylepis.1